jgi:hypothetical protein
MNSDGRLRQPRVSMDELARAGNWSGGRLFCDERCSPRIGWASFDTTTPHGMRVLAVLLDGECDVVMAGMVSEIAILGWACVPCVSDLVGADEAHPVPLIYMAGVGGRVFAAVGDGALHPLEQTVQRRGLGPWQPAARYAIVRAPSLQRWSDVALLEVDASGRALGKGAGHAH